VRNLARAEIEIGETSSSASKFGVGLRGTAVLMPVGLEPAPEEWFVVQTRYRFERKVSERLFASGLEVFLPLRKENRAWSDRSKVISVPLFPGYNFMYSAMSLALRLLVLQVPGVMGFVSVAGTAATVPPKQIEDLRLLLAGEVLLASHPYVAAGRRARIRGGSLNGVEGLLTHEEKNKLVISIECIQRSVAVDTKNREVELI
jgi:transcription antitermination factor NusG